MQGYETTFWKDSFIHESAKIGKGVYIGPFCLIGPNVTIGEGTRIEGHSSIGTRPEHKSFWADDSLHGVSIGKNCIIREFTTINSGTNRKTKVGDNVVLLRGSHVGHDAIVSDKANISCNVLLGGHSFVGEGANLGLGAIVHQFRAIGPYSMTGMGSVVTRDVVPFSKTFGSPAKYQGVNKVGVERALLDLDSIVQWLNNRGPESKAGLNYLHKEEYDLVRKWLENIHA